MPNADQPFGQEGYDPNSSKYWRSLAVKSSEGWKSRQPAVAEAMAAKVACGTENLFCEL